MTPLASSAFIEFAVAAAIGLVLLIAAAGEEGVRLLYLSGAAAIALGLIAGIPAGIVYHVKLSRALAATRAAEPGWWWRPASHHARLPEQLRAPLLPWFHAGAAGFLVALAGCALVLLALLAG